MSTKINVDLLSTDVYCRPSPPNGNEHLIIIMPPTSVGTLHYKMMGGVCLSVCL